MFLHAVLTFNYDRDILAVAAEGVTLDVIVERSGAA